ncbi:PoNe immunity protein domain-containing protein [Agarivorans aestuarii]|uniref:PoNe immunity protein domain-containing protein n=1 Tax=Agarivorans aestuarii TaxID=1563703 RepID=UPI001C81D0F0|nr:PoNe immunity protein domain-containing protein [Agarivorans aestuarii]
MIRDQRRDEAYFSELISDLDEALAETQQALDNEVFTSLSEQVDVTQQLYQLAIMRAVAHYSYGSDMASLKSSVLAILTYRQQLSATADKLPAAHQCYRHDFERLGGVGEACGSANVNRYVYVLWWLALLVAVGAEQAHIQQALDIIGEQGNDALLDSIASRLGDTDRPMSPTLYYPTVYQPLLDAINSDGEVQAEHLNVFIRQWYDSLEDADWYDNHLCDCEFEYTDYYVGYWCLEASLVASLFCIPEDAIREHVMVPVELVSN